VLLLDPPSYSEAIDEDFAVYVVVLDVH
jgi:hypothetical protein